MSDLKEGRLARLGLLDEAKLTAAAELLDLLGETGVETVRVLCADSHGILAGKTVVAGALASVFRSGLSLPSTLLLKDTSNRTVFPIWDGGDGDLGPLAGAADMLLVPDPATFRTLPWSPQSAWILCDPVLKSGDPIPFAARPILARAEALLAEAGYALTVGLEVEFHVFERLSEGLEHADTGMPGRPPQTRLLSQGLQYLSETQYDRLEPVMDDLRRAAAALGLPVRSTEVEMGPSQFEFTFEPASPMVHADNMVMFRTMVKEMCARRGLHATFMCRPRVENTASSGWHLHQSLTDLTTGANLFQPEADGVPTQAASAWIAGLLAHAAESCLLSTPTVNGYKRYQPFQLAPDRIQWGLDNRGAMVRALLLAGDPASRIENRVAEPAANPYLFFASQILSGLSGLKQGLRAPDPVEQPYAPGVQMLPPSLIAAIEAFEGGHLYRDMLGQAFVDYMSTLKRAEWMRYLRSVSEWEQSEYFGLF
ncbi:MAG: glutamine synthetase family protein [Qingshengfaniella sp.]